MDGWSGRGIGDGDVMMLVEYGGVYNFTIRSASSSIHLKLDLFSHQRKKERKRRSG